MCILLLQIDLVYINVILTMAWAIYVLRTLLVGGSQVGWRRSGLLPQTLYISHRNLWQVNADEEHQWSERNHADQPVDQAQDCDGVHIEGGGEGIDRTARTMNVLCKIVNK